MAKKYSKLRAKMSPGRRAKNEAGTREILSQMPLHELRAAREFTQIRLAQSMGISQASVSKMERITDMYISTLREFVAAMGGDVKIRAVFPDGEVEIDQFENLSILGN